MSHRGAPSFPVLIQTSSASTFSSGNPSFPSFPGHDTPHSSPPQNSSGGSQLSLGILHLDIKVRCFLLSRLFLGLRGGSGYLWMVAGWS